MGDLSSLADRYQALTGTSIDKACIEFHTAGFNALNGFLLWPLAFHPVPDQDYVAYLNFALGTCRWGIEAIAECLGIELGEVQDIGPQPASMAVAGKHLVGVVSNLRADGDLAGYERDRAACLARYLDGTNEYGATIMAQNLEDASDVVGRRLTDSGAAETALVEFIRRANPDQDSRLAVYFHRRLHRHDFLLRDCGASSWLTGTHLQRITAR